jgi:hypothetical protein
MSDELTALEVLRRHEVPFVVIGGHAVNYHGYGRTTEDVDVVWIRSAESEKSLLAALIEIDAAYIGSEIDPATGLERTHPLTLPFIQSSRLMMLCTRYGFLDLFDYVPGLGQEKPERLLAESVESAGFRYASLPWLRQMKAASGREKDLLDLQNLPKPPDPNEA